MISGMLTVWRRRHGARPTLGRITGVFVAMAIVVVLPGLLFADLILPDTVFGFDGGFFFTLFIMPVLLGGITWLFAERIDDGERHSRKYENE